MRLGLCAAAVLVVTLTACGQESSPATSAGASAVPDSRSPNGSELAGPPPLTLHRPEGDVDLPAYAWCYQSDAGAGGCADGAPPAHPARTAATGPLTFSFPLEGWAFTASFRQRGPRTECERNLQVDAVAQGDGTFVVPALGPAGRWDVEISGYADRGGDLFTIFDWTTSADATATPFARGEVGLLGPPSAYGDDAPLEAYGPSLRLTGLAVESTEVTAELALSDGAEKATYPLSASRDDLCPDDGTIYLAGKHPNEALDLPDLGEPPYAYEVLLTLDGNEYVGTGQWPDDLAPATSNQLALTWSPPLPAWNGSP